MSTTKVFGIISLIISTILWLCVYAMPFIPLSLKTKLIISPIFAIVGEILFWVGSFIIGKDIVKKYMKYLNPINWFKRKPIEGQ